MCGDLTMHVHTIYCDLKTPYGHAFLNTRPANDSRDDKDEAAPTTRKYYLPSRRTSGLITSERLRPIGCQFLLAIAPHDGRGACRAKSRNVSETRARMRSRSRSRRLPPPAPGFQLPSRGDGVPDQAATRSAGRAVEYPPPCGRSEPVSRAKHALRPQARPASRDARELSTWR
jgi:hypothetical protein